MSGACGGGTRGGGCAGAPDSRKWKSPGACSHAFSKTLQLLRRQSTSVDGAAPKSRQLKKDSNSLLMNPKRVPVLKIGIFPTITPPPAFDLALSNPSSDSSVSSMNLKVATLAVLTLSVFSVVSPAGETSPSVCVVSNVEELLAVQQVVGSPLDAAGDPVTIKVLSGRYLLKDTFRIARSKVSLIAEPGALFQLLGNINEPVIAIGTQAESAGPADVI